MNTLLTFLEFRADRDIVLARQRARVVANRLGFESQDQIRIATAVSEVARLVIRSGRVVRIEFLVEGNPGSALSVRVFVPRSGGNPLEPSGLESDGNFDGARRMMDTFAVESSPESSCSIAMTKSLPRRGQALTAAVAIQMAEDLAQIAPTSPVDELLRQNRELLRVLDDLRNRELELAQLNGELEETNRGVVALYHKLDQRADSFQKASELKTRFLSNVSHEFRTPLTSVLSMGRLLLDGDDGPLNPEQQRQVRYILRAAHDLSSMVNDLLDLARIEAGRDEVLVGEVALPEFFGVMRGMLRPLLPTDSPVELVFDLEPDLPVLVTDEGKLVQVVRNLVSNALKFTERGEVRVRANLDTEAAVSIVVEDTGIGIDPAHFERIFEEFGQIDSPAQRKSKGSGLGLPLARKLTQLLGGTLEVTSELGVGSTFTATLPVVYPRPDWASSSVPHSEGFADV